MTIRGYSFPAPEKISPATSDTLKKEKRDEAWPASEKGRFADLRPEDRIRAKYRMGWDALHALEVKKLDE